MAGRGPRGDVDGQGPQDDVDGWEPRGDVDGREPRGDVDGRDGLNHMSSVTTEFGGHISPTIPINFIQMTL